MYSVLFSWSFHFCSKISLFVDWEFSNVTLLLSAKFMAGKNKIFIVYDEELFKECILCLIAVYIERTPQSLMEFTRW